MNKSNRRLAGVAAALATAWALLRSRDANASDTDTSEGDMSTNTYKEDTSGAYVMPGYQAVNDAVDRFAREASLSKETADAFRLLAQAQAHSESRGVATAGNSRPSEVASAKRALEARDNKGRVTRELGVPKSWEDYYRPGSRGLYGIMPVNLLNLSKGKDIRSAKISPKDLDDPYLATLAYASFVQKLTDRSEYQRSPKTLNVLKVGGASPTLMDNPEASRYQKALGNMEKAIAELGLPSDTGTRRIPRGGLDRVNFPELAKQAKGA